MLEEKMCSRSVLTLGLLFCLFFGAVWDVTRAYMQMEPAEDNDPASWRDTTPSKPTESLARSKGQMDSSTILFPGEVSKKKCEDTYTCSNLDTCTSTTKTNDVCGWNDTRPLVCCFKATSRNTKVNPRVQLDKRLFPENECYRRPQVHIVGGIPVKDITTFPFMVSLFRRIGENRMFQCGGVLIGRKHVLTAAHCFLSRDGEYDVISGLVNLKSIENGRETFTIHPVTKIHLHPKFKFPILDHDIAILTIPSLDFNPTTRLVCLPFPFPESEELSRGTILGWGSTQSYGNPSDVLNAACVDFVNRTTCEQANNQSNAFFLRSFPNGITPEIVCAGNTVSGRRDACHGDSGGPLLVVDEHNVWRVVGVVSSGFKCGVVGVPGIYIRVDQYMDWIQTTAEIN